MTTSPAPDRAALEPATVRVDLGDRSYDVVVGSGILDRAGALAAGRAEARRAAVLTQPSVRTTLAARVAASLADAGLKVDVLEVPDGEAAKTLAVLGELYSRLAQIPLRRQDVVVAVGGGSVGDLGGFLAATWNRGVPVLQIPSTVLAQVDASIGGKTGVNLAEGKNLVGAFHQPVGVLADVDVLGTLPQRQVAGGLGEVVKYGLIRDPDILDVLESDPGRAVGAEREIMHDLVTRSVRVKAAVVSSDEREGGERAHLNFGHTFGHALEAATGYSAFQHGEAVAVGMLVALHLGVRLGVTDEALVPRVRALLEQLQLPVRAPTLARDELWEIMARDKKAGEDVRFVLVSTPGEVEVVTPPREDVDAAIDAVENGDEA